LKRESPKRQLDEDSLEEQQTPKFDRQSSTIPSPTNHDELADLKRKLEISEHALEEYKELFVFKE